MHLDKNQKLTKELILKAGTRIKFLKKLEIFKTDVIYPSALDVHSNPLPSTSKSADDLSKVRLLKINTHHDV